MYPIMLPELMTDKTVNTVIPNVPQGIWNFDIMPFCEGNFIGYG
jgi:hypothetical protein